MAAPITVYSSNKLPISGSTTTTLPLALNLSSYSNIKEHFYLDKVFRVEDDFIGMVKNGSTNYTYHNPNRFSKLRAKDESNGEVYLICNDGGLNTFAHSKVDAVKSTAVNHIKADYIYKSSFYANSTLRGYEIRANNGSWTNVELDNTALPPTINENKPNEIYYSVYSHPSLIQIKPYIVNEEGKKFGDTVSFNSTPEIQNISALKRTTVCSTDGETQVEIWMYQSDILLINSIPDYSSNTGIYAYQNDEFTQYLENGYYFGLKPNHSIQVQSGQMIQAIYCTPAPIAKDFQLYIFNEFNPDGDDTVYSVSVVLPVAKNYDITIVGTIASFNSLNQQLSDDSGSGYFNIFIPAGETNGSQNTSYIPSPSNNYIKCIVNSTNPSGLTYDSFEY